MAGADKVHVTPAATGAAAANSSAATKTRPCRRLSGGGYRVEAGFIALLHGRRTAQGREEDRRSVERQPRNRNCGCATSHEPNCVAGARSRKRPHRVLPEKSRLLRRAESSPL